MDKINIRGVSFCNTTMDEAVSFLWDAYDRGEQCAVFTPNSEIVQNCIDTPELYEVINSAEVTIPDGIGVIKAA
ncbi:MAG: glycosyltransferase, partial [Clostridia bacterium]|nr:glycosyltransferase [Clostridia bacterium]